MLLLFCRWFMLLMHPFYVSVTDINHNSSEKTVEVSVKIFTDDFEHTLRKAYNQPVDLVKPVQKRAADSLVAAYLRGHLHIKTDGRELALRYLGYEREQEAVWCYLEASNVNTPVSVEVDNTLLYDNIQQQINMIHVTVKNVRKSGKLDYPDSSLMLKF